MIKSYLKWRNKPSEQFFGGSKIPAGDKIVLCIIAIVSVVAFYYRITGRI